MARFGGFQKVARHLGLRFQDPRGSRQDVSAAAPAPDANHSGNGRTAAATAAATASAPAAAGSGSGTRRRSDRPPERPSERVAATGPPAADAEQSPALREAAAEMAALMREEDLDYVPGRAELEAAGKL